MAVTEIKIVGESPTVRMIPHQDGSVTAVLDFYREKPRGGIEQYTVSFRYLSTDELACIGRSARIGVFQAREKANERMTADYDRIITPGS